MLIIATFQIMRSRSTESLRKQYSIGKERVTGYYSLFSKGATEIELATHFGMLFGPVNQCKFARDYQGTMVYFKEIAELQDEKKRLEAKVNIPFVLLPMEYGLQIKHGVSKDLKRVGALDKKITNMQNYVAKKLNSTFEGKIENVS